MRTIPIAALLCTASMFLPCAYAQQSDADHQALAELLAKAEKGDAESQHMVGQAFYLGEFGLAADFVEATKWYRRAADQNHAGGQSSLGFCYWHGDGVAQDYVEAVKWYRRAAEQNNAVAQYNLGVLYRDGQGVAKDDVEAVKWYRRAAEQNHADAQRNLGVCYVTGQGVAKDGAEAAKWFRRAAEQNHADAQYNLGVLYANGQGVAKDEVEAVKWYRRAAEQKDAKAQVNLGVCYRDGQGVAGNDVEAVKWFRRAAEQNNAQAQHHMGWCYVNGRGVAADYVEALKWYSKAAEQNHVEAQYNLGWIYYEGKGVAPDYVEAVKWWRKAAALNDARALNGMGVCYLRGQGVAKDEAAAVKWFRKAAEQNLAQAQRVLGLGYLNGQGVAKDEVEAYKWWLLAAAQGDDQAKVMASAREMLMSREQVAEGKRRAQDWLAQWKARPTPNPVKVEDDVTLRWEFGSKEALADWAWHNRTGRSSFETRRDCVAIAAVPGEDMWWSDRRDAPILLMVAPVTGDFEFSVSCVCHGQGAAQAGIVVVSDSDGMARFLSLAHCREPDGTSIGVTGCCSVGQGYRPPVVAVNEEPVELRVTKAGCLFAFSFRRQGSTQWVEAARADVTDDFRHVGLFVKTWGDAAATGLFYRATLKGRLDPAWTRKLGAVK